MSQPTKSQCATFWNWDVAKDWLSRDAWLCKSRRIVKDSTVADSANWLERRENGVWLHGGEQVCYSKQIAQIVPITVLCEFLLFFAKTGQSWDFRTQHFFIRLFWWLEDILYLQINTFGGWKKFFACLSILFASHTMLSSVIKLDSTKGFLSPFENIWHIRVSAEVLWQQGHYDLSTQ